MLVLGAVGLWVLMPADPEVKAAAGAAEQVRRDVRGEVPPEQPIIVEHVEPPSAPAPFDIANIPAGAVLLVEATFEVMTDGGRVPGTRVNLRSDAGAEVTGLADMSGLARILVRPGTWRATCTNDCKPVWLTIAPRPALYTLDTHHWLTISGEVVDVEGRPVSGVGIDEEGTGFDKLDRDTSRGRRVFAESGRNGGYALRYAVTDAAGRFSFVTEDERHVLFAVDGDNRSMPVVVAAPQSGVRFKLFSYAPARFTFRGRTKNERAVLHGVVADAPYGAFIEPRRRIALPVGAHQAVLTQRIGDQLYSAKAAFTITAAGENEIEVTFEQTHGLRVKVIDQANTPLGGVTVFASLRPANTDQFPEVERKRCWPDAGALEGEAMSLTATDGSLELLPPLTAAEPIYELSLAGPWSLEERKMMRPGDEPVTLVAVPR